ncbi:hypothetical protein M885DRAFT_44439 [Pelagophyceae sp. CCMP2097]|nr:hypothetical protein M885DRAFT_44439 [Pelagophyceae sp. CCMP2097]
MDGRESPERINICCTRCEVELSETVGGCAHPRLAAAVCVLCYEEVEEHDDDACAWCGDGGTLFCCDDCDLAFCEACLARNVDAAYALDVAHRDAWTCIACDATPLKQRAFDLATVLRWDCGCSTPDRRVSDESNDECKLADDDAVREKCITRLFKIESEIAESQEALEAEAFNAVEADIRAELDLRVQAGDWIDSTEGVIDGIVLVDLDAYSRLHLRKLELLELSQTRAQERLDAAKGRLEDVYMALAAADASGAACAETEAWRSAPQLARRLGGRVGELASRQANGAGPAEGHDASASDKDGSDDEPEYEADASAATRAAEAFMLAERPIKRKRVNGRLDGATFGANGFEARRRAELGSDVYDAVYKSEHPFAALSTLKKQVEGYDLSDDDEVIELDSNWRNDIDANALYGPEVRALIEANEAKSLLSAGLAIRLQTVRVSMESGMKRAGGGGRFANAIAGQGGVGRARRRAGAARGVHVPRRPRLQGYLGRVAKAAF